MAQSASSVLRQGSRHHTNSICAGSSVLPWSKPFIADSLDRPSYTRDA